MPQLNGQPLAYRPRCHSTSSLAAAALAVTIGGSWFATPLAIGIESDIAVQQGASGSRSAVALASADFDEDGVPDLVTGYATGERGVLTIRRGNVDAIHPNAPAARQRRRGGPSAAGPFLNGARTTPLPVVPHRLQTGDFDADGHADVIAAASSGDAFVLRGRGNGTLGPPQLLSLPGGVTALAVGDFHTTDGLADLAIGVTSTDGARLFVFADARGAWHATPDVFELTASATAVTFADVTADRSPDVAIAAGRELTVVRGQALPPATTARQAPARVERRTLPFGVRSMHARDINGDRQADLTMTGDDGATYLLTNRAEPAARAAAQGGGLEHWRLARVDAPAASAAAAVVLPMRLNDDGRVDLVTIEPGAAEPSFQLSTVANTQVVVNTNDSGPGSLRQAILDANASPGDDRITFDIPGPAPYTIVPLSPLPGINPDNRDVDGVVIVDGTSEPDFAGTPVVEISGEVVGAAGAGLAILTSDCVVRGLVINRFGAGLLFESQSGFGVQSGFVEGNYLGTDVTGTLARGNGSGVTVTLDASGVTVGGTVPAARNVVSGNSYGVVAGGFSATVSVQGSYIGTDASGTKALGNVTRGISVSSGGGYVIGGPAPGARNVISANGLSGVILTDSGPNLVSGNFVGTDVTGTRALGNAGIGIDAPEGETTITDNLVSGNGSHGIVGTTLGRIDVRRNRVGTNRAGTAALGNAGDGIHYSGMNRFTVDNLVSGNGGHGIFMGGMGHEVQGNRIGTDITGTKALRNRRSGVYMEDVANLIGGTTEGAPNIIAFNGENGITVATFFAVESHNNSLLSNAVFSNGGLGIDLGNDGVTPNDACDEDTGGNDLQNYPELSAVTRSRSALTISGQLNSKPGREYLIQFFSSPAANPSGFGEGARVLGSTTVTTDGGCLAPFVATLPVPVTPGHVITATATDPSGGTSEFSHARPFAPQTSDAAIRALMAQVGSLVGQEELNGLAGFVLSVKLQAALFLVERDHPRPAAAQVRGFIRAVELLVRLDQLDPSAGQALLQAADQIIAALAST